MHFVWVSTNRNPLRANRPIHVEFRHRNTLFEIGLNMGILLFVSFSGIDVVIVKNGRRICGTGGALANAPLVQNKSYFEVKIQCTGKNCNKF